MTASAVHLRGGGVSVVLDASSGAAPGVAYWGADLGILDDAALATVIACTAPAAIGSHQPDLPQRVSLCPEHATGWLGRPGLEGSGPDGSRWAPGFILDHTDSYDTADGGQAVVIECSADGLSLTTELALGPSGLLKGRHTLTNTYPSPYEVRSLALSLPVPMRAGEIMDFAGRWARERSPQRHPWQIGVHQRDARGGKGGHNSAMLLLAGTENFGFRRGEVWGVHIGWSGNTTAWAERSISGVGVLAGGELLHPHEVVLGEGDSYSSPWLYAAYSDRGLDGLSSSLHRWMRSRSSHPSLYGRPRPVTLNVWEAVYFDHDLDRLRALADAAAEVGVERFVLDDGWFRHRRQDSAGLGDWYVDEGVWPQGLQPLADVLTERGMEFGLWFEPEMVNLDSDVARQHPDWILGASSGLPAEQRHQQVLDIGQDAAFNYVLNCIDALLTEYPIAAVKWDHNRNLIAASTVGGTAGVHAQTLALYRMLDELRLRHPAVEFESCASGGGRIDLGILQRTERVWASDTNDALERQMIQRWTGLLLPPEVIGSHVGPTRSHTTDRTHDLSFRAATSLFGHFGIEWDVTAATSEERAELRRWVAYYKHRRHLLHSGDVVRADVPDDALWLHGVVAADRSAAVYGWVRLRTSVTETCGSVALPGLDPRATYHVRIAMPEPPLRRLERHPLPIHDGVTASGRVLGTVGLQLPGLHPEHAVILEAIRI